MALQGGGHFSGLFGLTGNASRPFLRFATALVSMSSVAEIGSGCVDGRDSEMAGLVWIVRGSV